VKTAIFAVLIMALALGACDETDPLTEDEEFILAVMVTDPDGRPLAGMSVGRLSSLEGIDLMAAPAFTEDYTRPNPFEGSTTVEYTTTEVSEVLVEVLDWRGEHVRTIQEGRIQPGMHSVLWDCRDAAGAKAMNGVYYFRVDLTDTLDIHERMATGTALGTVFDLEERYRIEGFGTTDATGFYSTRDLDLFPSLQGHAPQDEVGPMGDLTGTFWFSDTVTIRVSTPPPPAGGWIYHMSRDVVLVDGPNYFEFRFVPDDSTGVF
jgi:hypothetical protein